MTTEEIRDMINGVDGVITQAELNAVLNALCDLIDGLSG